MTAVRAPAALSLRLREGTSAKHRVAEQAPFVRSLLGGRMRPNVYACFVQGLYFVYAEMESALDRHRRHPVVAHLDLPGLRRLSSLEDDLSWWRGPSWRDGASPSLATRAYCGRIQDVAGSAPPLLVGHLYTRYLSDLSGGQVLGRAVERAFGLVDGTGTAFYRFGGTADRIRLKERFRARLDELPVDATTTERIVAEACRAFDHNQRLFDELVASRDSL